MSANEASCLKSKVSACKSTQSRCGLCHERLKVDSHPVQWESDLQEILLQYVTIPSSSCVCRADQVSIKKGLGLAGKPKDEFAPRWVKRKMQKHKPDCCIPGCGMVADRTCVFTSLNAICAAGGVGIGKSTGVATTSSFPLCTQHYHTVYKHCNPERVLECALCGCKRIYVDTLPAVPCAGHSEQSPSLRMLMICYVRQMGQ